MPFNLLQYADYGIYKIIRKSVKIVTVTIDNEVNEYFLLRQGDKPELLTETRHRFTFYVDL